MRGRRIGLVCKDLHRCHSDFLSAGPSVVLDCGRESWVLAWRRFSKHPVACGACSLCSCTANPKNRHCQMMFLYESRRSFRLNVNHFSETLNASLRNSVVFATKHSRVYPVPKPIAVAVPPRHASVTTRDSTTTTTFTNTRVVLSLSDAVDVTSSAGEGLPATATASDTPVA